MKTKTEGFKGVMKTFDNTRPMVAAMALGVSRAALEFTKEKLEEEGFLFRYGLNKHQRAQSNERSSSWRRSWRRCGC